MSPLLGLALLVSSTVAPNRPNVVFILADDVGYGDLGSYGAKLTHTPNLDALARRGIRFTDAHSPSTFCTPTRYAMLTGEYAFRHAPGAGILSGVAPLCIPSGKATLPAMLKKAGYATGVVGKWHLGLGEKTPDFNGTLEPGAKSVGFDYNFLIPATGDRVPCVYVEDGKVVGHDPSDPIQVSFGPKVGTEPTGRENPELLKIKPVVGHNGTIVNGVSRIGFMSGGRSARWVDEDMADTLVGRATAFIEKNQSRPFFLYLPTHDVHAPLLPHPRFNGVSQCGLRGDTLAELDWTVGEVYRTLERLKLDKNTIFIFSSDNGGVESDGYADPRENLNGHKVNGALRGEKYSLYEGGHRVPLLVSWPSRAPKGRTSSALVGLIDLFASLSSLLEVSLAKDEAPDSFNLRGALFEGRGKGRADMVHHQGGANGALAYREGSHVLVPKGRESWELFDLSRDLEQKRNLAEDQPDRVIRMKESLARRKEMKRTRP